eukprot:5769789-Alexandrium_andersonii.AAC.1
MALTTRSVRAHQHVPANAPRACAERCPSRLRSFRAVRRAARHSEVSKSLHSARWLRKTAPGPDTSPPKRSLRRVAHSSRPHAPFPS